MNKQEFGQLFFKSLSEAANIADKRLGKSVSRSFEIELHGADHSGSLLSTKDALDALYIDDGQFFKIIDVAVIGISPKNTRMFVRVSGHIPSSFDETWNQPPGMGPFKQLVSDKIYDIDSS